MSDHLPAREDRVIFFDVLNILAALAVIFLHCNGIVHNFRPVAAWYQALVVEVALYWPVPVFFMLSGATLMGYRQRYTTRTFLQKRLVKAVIPFVAWSLIHAVLKRMDPFHIGLQEFLNRFLSTSFESVYWFFLPLFAVYLAMPVLALLKEQRRILWYMVGCTFLLTSLLPPVLGYCGIRWNESLSMVTMGGYLLYVVLGYLLSVEEIPKKLRWLLYGLGLGSMVLRYGMTVYLSLCDGAINKTFFGYTQYHAVFLAAAVFVFFRYDANVAALGKHPKVASALKTLSGCSLGVYLMHTLIMVALGKVLPTDGWLWRLAVPFLVYGLGVAATLILKKIPLLKRIVP